MTANLSLPEHRVTERMRRDLERYLRWLGADAALAADLAQESLVRLWQTPPIARTDEAIATWLRTVARNLFRSAAAATRPGVPLDDAVLLEASWRRFSERDVEGAMTAALSRCLATLPDRTRRVVELHYEHGLSHRELAPAVGISAAGIKRLLARARALLADCIERERNDEEDL